MRLFFKYMVSNRCIMHVKAELEKLNLSYTAVKLGEAEMEGDIPIEQLEKLNTALKKAGIELLEDKKAILIEKIKIVILELVHYTDEPLIVNFSVHLSRKLGYDYTYLANIFSNSLGITIEHFHIVQKIERVKELLFNDEMSITDIAWTMQYSSKAHLSTQFKKITGFTPSGYKKQKQNTRQKLEDL